MLLRRGNFSVYGSSNQELPCISNRITWFIVLIALISVGCKKSSDSPAAQTSTTNLPLSPICTVSMYNTDGSISGPANTTLKVPIPNYSTAKGDAVNFSYKRSTAVNWSPFHPGFFSDVEFTMAGSTVTVKNTTNLQYDWALSASINECH